MRRITCVNVTAFVFSFIFTVSAVAGENSSLVAIPPQLNTIVGQHRSTGDSKMKASGERYTFVFSGDQIFPHMAMGGGWETILVLVNMSSTPISFTQKFFNTLGEPMRVTFRSVPERVVTTTASVDGRLAPNGTLNFVLFDAGGPLQTGWSSISYDTTNARIGGYAIFRSRVTNRTDFEALVPLSGYDDTAFYLPFDNLEGFVTSMAILNPASNMSNRVSLSFLDSSGSVILNDTIMLAPGQQIGFSLPQRYPTIAGRVGSVYVQSETTTLSALGFRFNPQGAFATIPIMNWSGMF